MRSTVLVVSALALALGPSGLTAQDVAPPPDSLAQEIARLRARLDSLERVLEQLLATTPRVPHATPPEAPDELAALRAAALAAVERDTAVAPAAAAPAESRTRNLQLLNPEISITGDAVGNFTARPGGPTNVSATPREFEFSFQSALDPYTRTKIFVTREEDFEIAGMEERETEGEGADAEEEPGFEIEEGYMYWVGLPGGLGAKVGKFRQEMGLYNRWHTHALLEVERPLAATTFLGEDGLIQTGASVTLPSLVLGPATQTATLEVTRGSNEVLFARGSELSYLGRLQSFWDLGASSYLQLGATGLIGENDEAALTSRLLQLDAAFRWRPPGRARYRDLTLKAEWYLLEREEAVETETAQGGYLQANYRLNQRWIVGARADYVEPLAGVPRVVQLAPSLTLWQSEWVRLRVQYNYLKRDGGRGNHTVLLQTVWAAGPHKHETY